MRIPQKCSVWLVVIAASVAALAGCRDTGESARPVLSSTSPVVATAVRNFEYDGGPIHPKLVERFSGWLSDVAPPVVVVVDVSAATLARNEYGRDDVRVDEKGTWYEKGAWYEQSSSEEQFGYRHVGSMTNGTCVLLTWEWGGGSGVFSDLLLVRFRESREDGHLLMYVVGRECLGGRGQVTVKLESVEVAAASNIDGKWPRLRIKESECQGVLDP